ncbi:hypothetical protein N7461_000225 [Penicillium sp. DV-2018c]|nr:hypothetical protein N7461_000225 [Penicillium sp. DV-2018c]
MPDDTVPPAYLRPRSDAHAGRVPQATVSLAREVTNSLRVLRTELKELSEVFANALQHNLFQQMAPTPPPPAITIDITLEQIYGTDFLDYYGIPRNAQLLHPIAQAGLRNAN